jgi:hypothetical protein
MGLLSTIGAASARAYGFTRSAIAAAVDAYFNRVTLLLPGNGTNGAQNNTFLDSSTNNFTITRNGNATQGTFSPFSQTGWSNYFNGSSYFSIPSAAYTSFANNADWTIELWFNTTVASATFFSNYVNSSPYSGAIIALVTGGQLDIWDGGTHRTSAITGLNDGKWHHVAWVNSSGTSRVYVDGTLTNTNGAASWTTPATVTRQTNWDIGFQNGGVYLTGYISNLRVVKGTAVYTSNFTPSTTPLGTTSGGQNPPTGTQTVLLTCQSNRFVDNSSNAAAITVNGTPSVQAFSPFAPAAAYSASTVGGSGYFDGTGDYLSVADNANLRLGTSAFTIQAWIYRSAVGTAHSIIAKGGASTGFVFQITSGNVLRFTHTTTNIDTTTTIPASAWTHVAAVRTNTSTNGFQLYINGVSSATATVATDFNQTDTLYIGADRSAATPMNGYISGLKYTNGTAESISVPTAPPTATTNVALLTNFTNAGITDATGKNVLETVGNAQISTTQSKFGGSSMSFDGTGDWLLIPHSVDQMLGTGAFTIEMWVYRNSSGTYGLVGKGTGTTGWLVSLNSSNQVVFTYGSSTITSTGTVSATTWTYIAVVREGTGTNQTKIYINGTNDGTGTVSTDFNQTNGMYVGADRTGGSAFNGYIDDLRITKGQARTVTTTPTSAFALQ